MRGEEEKGGFGKRRSSERQFPLNEPQREKLSGSDLNTTHRHCTAQGLKGCSCRFLLLFVSGREQRCVPLCLVHSGSILTMGVD